MKIQISWLIQFSPYSLAKIFGISTRTPESIAERRRQLRVCQHETSDGHSRRTRPGRSRTQILILTCTIVQFKHRTVWQTADMGDLFDYVWPVPRYPRGPLHHHRVECRPNEFPSRRISLELTGRGRARTVLSEQFRIFIVQVNLYDRTG